MAAQTSMQIVVWCSKLSFFLNGKPREELSGEIISAANEKTETLVAASGTFPAPVYRKTVLEELFRNAQLYFLEPLLQIQYAHALMLVSCGIIPEASAAICLRGLRQLPVEQIRVAAYDPAVEDLYFYLEKKLTELCGAQHAGFLPVARSRNDVDLTMYRLVLRGECLVVSRSLLALRGVVLDLAAKHAACLMPAYTHQQPAQPTTLGHYLMASVTWLTRDGQRLQAAWERLNRSPLGACAITGTGFPIDRNYTADLLGFDGLEDNTYGAIASVDYLTEPCAALMVSMINLGRLIQDLLLWTTAEFGYLRLSDAFVQVSSIMPQKRNPVALEHVRVFASRALMQAQGVLTCLHNTPYADMNDAEDDIQPSAYRAFADAARALDLAAGLLQTAQFQTEVMEKRTHGSFLTVTELADTLARSADISFRMAHEIVSLAIRETVLSDRGTDAESIVVAVRRVFAKVTGQSLTIEDGLLLRALDPAHFVAIRKTPGGPSPEVLAEAIATARHALGADTVWVEEATARIERARSRLEERTDVFLQQHPAL